MEEYEEADLIVVPSTFALNSFVDWGLDRTKLAVVPYGVSLDVFNTVQRQSSRGFEVLFVGTLSVRKGARDLLEAFEAIDHSQKRLTIVGTIADDIRSALWSRLTAPNIRLLGVVPQISLKHVMGQSDALVLPSIEDGFGMVLSEALACGCPIVATTNTGARDLITDGVEGFVVPIRSPQIVAERLQRLADNPSLQQSMSAAALRKVREIGGWSKYGDAMMQVYARLQSRGGRVGVPSGNIVRQ
jgi:glycosyltransferase involved in cell wall biosynthesis